MLKSRKMCLAVMAAACAAAMTVPTGSEAVADPLPEALLQGLEYRNIGPFRGGRATAVAGVPSVTDTYYLGTVGGVWKTTDAGTSWKPISDDDMKTASVGAIALAPSDPNVVVVGMGESPYRGVASSHGDGVYISTDAGRTFTHAGLEDTRQISTVIIHPENPDIIYVAAQGSSWAPTEDRGVYKSTDGGKSWRRTLFESTAAGAVDLTIDTRNPRILYASLWDHQRQPWEIRSGGPASGLWKSTDGGENWTRLSKGLPKLMGKIGVAASPARAGRVWAIVEAEEDPGLYRSDDFGETWKKLNDERKLYARSWYYMHIFADPQDGDTVYVQNSAFYKSVDGGRTFPVRITGTHGDFHDFWINPHNPAVVGVANDGGGAVSFNGGKTWSTQMNQATAQFYRVNADNDFFYRVYGGQQDNSTVALRSHGPDGGIGLEDFHSVGGCESAHVSFDPDNPVTVYAGCYLGQISRWEKATGTSRNVMVYPEIAFGIPAVDRKYRFNWNAPIHVSRHDASVVYHAGNHVFRSANGGENWDVISPDLTKNDPETLGPGGRPITNEVSENYGTIFALAESSRDAGLLWAGSDDGLVHVTRDGGGSWQNVTPRRAGDGLVNSIEISPHDDARVYVAFARYKYNDHTPLIFRTDNGGGRWRNIAAGLPEGAFVRVVREDPVREGLLYAGTELGMFVSFNDGADWQPLRNNLPVVPVTDIKVHGKDLVLSTQGRAFWVLDDVTPLRTLSGDTADTVTLFAPQPAYNVRYQGRGNSKQAKNPPRGAVLYYTLPENRDAEAAVTLDILDADGATVRSFKALDAGKKPKPGTRYKVPAESGLNRAVWDLKADPRPGIKGVWSFAWGNRDKMEGPTVLPGTYTARLSVGETVVEQPFEVRFDPRFDVADNAWEAKATMMAEVDAMFVELTRSLIAVRDARTQVKGRLKRLEDGPLKEAGEALVKALDDWQDSVVSKDRTFFQDVLNYPDRLVSHLAMLYGDMDGMIPPFTQGVRDRFDDLKGEWTQAKAERDSVLSGDLAAFNRRYREDGLDAVILKDINND